MLLKSKIDIYSLTIIIFNFNEKVRPKVFRKSHRTIGKDWRENSTKKKGTIKSERLISVSRKKIIGTSNELKIENGLSKRNVFEIGQKLL